MFHYLYKYCENDNSSCLKVIGSARNDHIALPYEHFRNFCGKILSELFNTNLLTGYDKNVFNN